jgi:hypothetical protein
MLDIVNKRFDRQMCGFIIKNKETTVLRPKKNECKPYIYIAMYIR